MNGTRESKATLLMPGLTLSNGPLPPPALQYYDPVPAPSPTKADFNHTESAALAVLPGQLILTKPENATRPKHIEEHHAQRLDVVVRNQLSSIIAPVRRDTESSGSEVILEHETSDNEEDKCSDGIDDITHPVRFRTSDSTPTFVEDASYFETAMHHLEARRGLGNADEVSWSYQNARI
jgi:hypothetical protein